MSEGVPAERKGKPFHPVGALVGAGLGLLLMKGSLLGAVAGAVAGSLAGQGIQRQLGRGTRSESVTAVERSAGLVHLAVHVARADGPLSAAEREAIRAYFQRDAGLPESHVLAIDELIAAAEARPAGDATAALRTMPALDASDRTHVLFVLFRVALADGRLHAAEERALRDVAAGLGVAPDDLKTIREHFVAGGGPQGPEDDYRILGLEPGADAARVKEKYREAVRSYHPDRFQHLGDEFTSVAAEKFKKIQDAYGRLTSGRSAGAAPRTRVSVCARCRTFSPAQRVVCPRCDRPKHDDRGDHARLKCPFCTRTNTIPLDAFSGEVRCGNCKVLLVR